MSARRLLVALVLLVATTTLLGLALVVGAVGLVTGLPGGVIGDIAPGGASAPAPPIPPAMLELYGAAAATCPGLPVGILAAIGTVESGNGTSDLPGVHSGANAAGAEGPMQFEPSTFVQYDEPVPPGGIDPPSPYDPVDAVYAAARLLCANGASNGADLAGAVYAYNHSPAYVAEVMALAARIAGSGP